MFVPSSYISLYIYRKATRSLLQPIGLFGYLDSRVFLAPPKCSLPGLCATGRQGEQIQGSKQMKKKHATFHLPVYSSLEEIPLNSKHTASRCPMFSYSFVSLDGLPESQRQFEQQRFLCNLASHRDRETANFPCLFICDHPAQKTDDPLKRCSNEIEGGEV